MKLRIVVGVNLTQGKDDDLLEEINQLPKGQAASRLRDLARKGLVWEDSARAMKEG